MLLCAGMVYQAMAFELLPDEAYYWTFSQDLAFGYFDHPPMIAWLIAPGYELLQGELGVRLIPLLMGISSLWFMRKLLPDDMASGYWWIAGGVMMVQFGVGSAVPDTPLVFFSLLFFLLLRRLENTRSNIGLWLATGVVVACMFYSKYHAVIPVVVSLFCFRWWFRTAGFYLAMLVVLLLMLPHVLWQIENEFPTLSYHLVERQEESSSVLKQLGDFLGGQFVVLGPLISIPLITILMVSESSSRWEGFVKATGVTTLLFLLLLAFLGRVEANWSTVAVPALVYFAVKSINQGRNRWLIHASVVSALLLFSLRPIMAYTSWLDDIPTVSQTKGHEEWSEQVLEVSGRKPVMFYNSYQKASLYRFYTGAEAFSYNTPSGRANQYDIWAKDQEFQCDSVVIMANWHIESWPQKVIGIDTVSISWSEQYYPVYRSTVQVLDFPSTGAASSTLSVQVGQESGGLPGCSGSRAPELSAAFISSKGEYWEYPLTPAGNEDGWMSLATPEKPGRYTVFIGHVDKWHLVWIGSPSFQLLLK